MGEQAHEEAWRWRKRPANDGARRGWLADLAVYIEDEA